MSIQADSIIGDPAPTILPDSLTRIDSADTTQNTAETKKQQSRDIETTIDYNAKDSIFFDVANQKLNLFGESEITYGDIKLEAELTSVNWEKKTIKSTYVLDSANKKVGRPVFTDRGEVYETDNILYNFKSRRAVIKGVVTEQDGAFMHGEDVKKNEDDELYIKHAKYTTCNLSHPHFFIESEKLKVIPGNKVMSGPFNLKFRTVPTPIWFPFGIFPQPRRKASGVIFPSYGEENRRGFFLRDGGYYLGINDYIDLRATADIYSKGGWGLDVTSNYRKRYAFGGSFNFSYNRSVSDEAEQELETNDFWVRWSFNDQSAGTSSFNASTSFGTSSYNSNNNLVNRDFDRSINSTFTSNVSYQKRFQGTPFNMSLSLRHNQNIQTDIMTLTAPELTWNMNRIYPLKKIFRSSKSPLNKLSFSHNFVFKNDMTNAPQRSLSGIDVVNDSGAGGDTLVFNFSNLDRILDRARLGGRHSIPVSTSFTFFKNFTMSPSFSYEEVWYTKELNFSYDDELQGVRIDTTRGFSRAGSWRTGASVNTIVYGFYPINGKRIQAIRHVITPSVSFSYNPDFRDPKFGVYQEIQVDSAGNRRTFSKYENFVYGSPSAGESRTMSFRLQNNLEMKVRNLKDSTGKEEFKKIKLFDNLSMGASYNFAAEAFKLSNITGSVRTSFFKNALSVTVNGTIDPYIYELVSESINSSGTRTVVQNRIDRFAWNSGQGIGQLSRLTTALSLNLRGSSGGGSKADTEDESAVGTTSFFDDPTISSEYGSKEELDQIRANPQAYVDFNIPWTFRASYSISRNKTGFADAIINQTFNFSGSFSLTEKTQVTFNSGIDLERNEFTTTRIGVSRDLHCWTMNFSWVPFGRFQSFSLIIRPKASLLQDLKLERRRNFNDFFNN